jgi:hypothetical protein
MVSSGLVKRLRSGGRMSTQEEEDDEGNEGKVWICRPYITVNGKRIYASQYGKEAFCFWADPR